VVNNLNYPLVEVQLVHPWPVDVTRHHLVLGLKTKHRFDVKLLEDDDIYLRLGLSSHIETTFLALWRDVVRDYLIDAEIFEEIGVCFLYMTINYPNFVSIDPVHRFLLAELPFVKFCILNLHDSRRFSLDLVLLRNIFMEVISQAVSIFYLIKPLLHSILPIFIIHDHTALPWADISSILLGEPLVLLLRPVHLDRVAMLLEVLPNSSGHLLFLGAWFPVSKALTSPDNSHLLICVLERVENSKTNCELFPEVIDLNIPVSLSNGYHLVKDLIVEHGGRWQDGQICNPIYSSLPINKLFILRINQNIFVLEDALAIGDQHWRFRDPYMILGPLQVAFEFFPKTELLDAAHDTERFSKLGLVPNFESYCEILSIHDWSVVDELWRLLVFHDHHLRIKFGSQFKCIINLILNHFEIIVIQNDRGVLTSWWVPCCYAR
jgi:hypothetical protein